MTGPVWLALLRATREGNGRDNASEIANRAGLPVRRAADILKGRVIPLREDLMKIVMAIDPEGEMLDEILQSYDDYLHGVAAPPSLDFDPPPLHLDLRTDHQILADALNALTRAVTLNTNTLLATHPKPEQP